MDYLIVDQSADDQSLREDKYYQVDDGQQIMGRVFAKNVRVDEEIDERQRVEVEN
jgi:hypothetical protein